MNGFVAAGGPAGAAAQERRVILAADQDHSRSDLLLEVALEAETLIARDQHFLVHRAVRLMASPAPLAQGLVLEDEGSELRRMALATGLVLGKQLGAAALYCRAAMRIMAIPAAHFALQHRVMVRQAELPLFIKMTLKTCVRRLPRIDDRVTRAARLVMNAPRPVARLAADVFGVVPGRL